VANIGRGRVKLAGRDGQCLMRWRRTRRGIACDGVAARVTEYLDGALSATDRARFEAHLDDCEDCRVYVAQFAQTLNALAALRIGDAGPESLDALLEAFRAHAA
jgi:anti-sigma factor RsiW